jgi:hypothetical protein
MASKPDTERRRSKRVSLESAVIVKADGVERKCVTKDISTGGAFFYCDAQIAQDSPIQLVMILPPEITGGEEQWACCHGRVMRVEESTGGQRGVAVKIERVSLSPLATA